MVTLRAISIGMIAVALVLGVLASGGALTGTVDRNAVVPISEDPRESLLAIEPLDPDGLTPPNADRHALFDVRNNMDMSVDLEVSPVGTPHTGPPPSLKAWNQHGRWSGQLGPAESATVEGTPVCRGVRDTETETFEFEFTATGTNVPIVLTVYSSVTVTCEGPPEQPDTDELGASTTDDTGTSNTDDIGTPNTDDTGSSTAADQTPSDSSDSGAMEATGITRKSAPDHQQWRPA